MPLVKSLDNFLTGKSCQNSGCEECQETPIGYHCGCPKGYRLLSDGKKCVDIDECALPDSCSQFCQNTVGSFVCSCEEDFYHLRSDRATCKARGEFIEIVTRFLSNCPLFFIFLIYRPCLSLRLPC